jgi:mannosyltransferase
LLVVTIDKNNKTLFDKLKKLIRSLGIETSIIVLGSDWNELPDIYAATDIYCTPSVMEGFGMTPQEAAATKVPIISSDLVPYVMEYLLGDNVQRVPFGKEGKHLKAGEGAIVVPADEVDGFTSALEMLLSDESLRKTMGENAYKMTIPYFTWDNMVRVFLSESGIETMFADRMS